MVSHLWGCRLHPLLEETVVTSMFVGLLVAAVSVKLAGLPVGVPAALLQICSI